MLYEKRQKENVGAAFAARMVCKLPLVILITVRNLSLPTMSLCRRGMALLFLLYLCTYGKRHDSSRMRWSHCF